MKRAWLCGVLLLTVLFCACQAPSDDYTKQIHLTVSCANALAADEALAELLPEDGALFDGDVYMTADESVFDVLRRTLKQEAIAMAFENSAYGVYVTSVGGIAQGDAGASSGYIFSVNGVAPMVSMDAYIPEDGDGVRLDYTVNGMDDVDVIFEFAE